MEITYDTGAKVILQGPVTYEVESERRVFGGGEVDGEAGEDKRTVASGEWLVNQKSEIRNPHYPLSTIHYSLSALPPPP